MAYFHTVIITVQDKVEELNIISSAKYDQICSELNKETKYCQRLRLIILQLRRLRRRLTDHRATPSALSDGDGPVYLKQKPVGHFLKSPVLSLIIN